MLPKFAQLPGFRLDSRKWGVAARKKLVEGSGDEALDGDEGFVAKKKRAVSTAKRTRKKAVTEMPEEEGSELEAGCDVESVESTVAASSKEAKKAPRRTQKKGFINLFCLFVLYPSLLLCSTEC